MAQRAFFYGWFLVPILFILYGFGITPAYSGWGIFATAVEKELNFSRAEIGGAFGIFTFLYSAVGLSVGLLQNRVSIRTMMSFGLLLSAAGFFWTGRASSIWEFYLGFGLVGGAGVGLATIIPIQTIAQHWFFKYRARVIAIVFTAGGVVGFFFPAIHRFMMVNYGWREGWYVVACVSLALAITAWLFVRDTPEEIGQLPDGESLGEKEKAATTGTAAPTWTAQQAIRTREFGLIVLAGIAYAVPWGVMFSHGPLYWSDQGHSPTVFAALLGTMSFVSIFGRLSGSLGDWIAPQYVLAGALVIESAGVAIVLVAESATLATIGVGCVGLGFGTAYISVPVVFSNFFGRRAFATTSASRMIITGVFNAAGPWLAGAAHDRFDSYTAAFIVLIVFGLVGAVAAAMARHPGEPPEILAQPVGLRVTP